MMIKLICIILVALCIARCAASVDVPSYNISEFDIRNTTRIVVSRYREDINKIGSWLLKYNNDAYVIMNRGDPNTIEKGFHSKKLTENVGRESYVYLQFIIANYDNLATFNIFAQADALQNVVFRRDAEDLMNDRLFFQKEQDGFAFFTTGL